MMVTCSKIDVSIVFVGINYSCGDSHGGCWGNCIDKNGNCDC